MGINRIKGRINDGVKFIGSKGSSIKFDIPGKTYNIPRVFNPNFRSNLIENGLAINWRYGSRELMSGSNLYYWEDEISGLTFQATSSDGPTFGTGSWFFSRPLSQSMHVTSGVDVFRGFFETGSYSIIGYRNRLSTSISNEIVLSTTNSSVSPVAYVQSNTAVTLTHLRSAPGSTSVVEQTVPTGSFELYAAIFDKSLGQSLYRTNGTISGSNSTPTIRNFTNNLIDRIKIGGYFQSSPNLFFHGEYSEIMIFTSAITLGQFNDLFFDINYYYNNTSFATFYTSSWATLSPHYFLWETEDVNTFSLSGTEVTQWEDSTGNHIATQTDVDQRGTFSGSEFFNSYSTYNNSGSTDNCLTASTVGVGSNDTFTIYSTVYLDQAENHTLMKFKDSAGTDQISLNISSSGQLLMYRNELQNAVSSSTTLSIQNNEKIMFGYDGTSAILRVGDGDEEIYTITTGSHDSGSAILFENFIGESSLLLGYKNSLIDTRSVLREQVWNEIITRFNLTGGVLELPATEDLNHRWRADSYTVGGTGNSDTWTDSISSLNLQQGIAVIGGSEALKPILSASDAEINNRPSLSFSSSWVGNSSPTFTTMDAGNDFTMVVLARSDNLSATRYYFGANNSTTANAWHQWGLTNAGRPVFFRVNAGAGAQYTAQTVSTGSWVKYVVRWDNANSKAGFSINGVYQEVAFADDPIATVNNWVRIGARSDTGTSNWIGKVAEIAIYNRQLTDTEMSGCFNYFSDYYNI